MKEKISQSPKFWVPYHLWLVVWNILYFFYILGIISPLTFIFLRGVETTNQQSFGYTNWCHFCVSAEHPEPRLGSSQNWPSLLERMPDLVDGDCPRSRFFLFFCGQFEGRYNLRKTMFCLTAFSMLYFFLWYFSAFATENLVPRIGLREKIAGNANQFVSTLVSTVKNLIQTIHTTISGWLSGSYEALYLFVFQDIFGEAVKLHHQQIRHRKKAGALANPKSGIGRFLVFFFFKGGIRGGSLWIQ